MDAAAQGPAILPPVEAPRAPRPFKRLQGPTPFTLVEAIRYYTGTDPDLIWGPFYHRYRFLRKSRNNWEGFSLGAIWNGIPVASQTRPGRIQQFFNWVIGSDPPPTITPAPLRSTSANPMAKPKFVESWQNEVNITDDWSPAQIDFAQWHGRQKHPADYDDEFFRTTYRTLYDSVEGFCGRWFGRGHLEDVKDRDVEVSSWEVPMTEQFIQYARMVAHEDRGYVNWKDVLNDPQHRKWLCVGVFAQIIERKVFNQLLFGAGKAYQNELDRHDSRWLLQEGFTRKEGRRQIARCSLGESLIPENFWSDVDDLAGQTVLIFQPLFMLTRLINGQTRAHDGAVFWQEVHTLLAMAGYFQVCMAVSPSVFHILSATPGARFQYGDEQHADQAAYDASRAFHGSHNERWRVVAGLSARNENAEVTRLVDALNNSDDDLGGAAAYMPLPSGEAEFRYLDHQRRRGGKVMYAVFPKVTRYNAENVGEAMHDRRAMRRRAPEYDQEEVIETGEGIRITILNRCMVVYYQGFVHSPADQDDGVPLEAHLSEIAWDRMAGGLFPYFRHYWAADGSPASALHWPLWPDNIDIFWLTWFLFVIVTQLVQWFAGEPPSREDRSVLTSLLYRPFSYMVIDAGLFLLIRALDMEFFRGPYLYYKIQAANVGFLMLISLLHHMGEQNIQVFSYVATTLVWLDKVLIQIFPKTVLALSGFLREETPVGIMYRVASIFTAANSTTAG